MYELYVVSNFKDWKWEIIEIHKAEYGGISKVIIFITGKGAYRKFANEAGVHRV